ncbi:scavenger receptor cysteine-rich domain-containing group B protein-like, partial [Dryobates pubescens]|uniref:scavenger receptor cysteine-rich domain-containing group B protein-like n=1 Tax=Dryobates pubescens TaxID=118200 RepID=UPI0023B9F70E
MEWSSQQVLAGPCGPQWVQKIPAGPSGSQQVPVAPSRSQWFPAGPSGSQQVPVGSQQVPVAPSRFQWLPAGPKPFPVRLAGGPGPCAGRVELRRAGRWGTVCDDDWGLPDAGVVCRQLGCGRPLAAPAGAWFGEGSGPIWLNGVRCRGRERRLAQCPHRGWRPHVCAHEEDASAVCSGHRFQPFGTTEPPWATTTPPTGTVPQGTACTGSTCTASPPGDVLLRLVGGTGRCAGRLEVFHEGHWGTVCDDLWGLPDAGVVCRQLGCGAALDAPRAAFFGEGSGRIWLDDVRCQGNESSLLQCSAAPWGVTNCQHREDAAVVCAGHRVLVSPTGTSPMASSPQGPAGQSRVDASQASTGRAPLRVLRISRLKAEQDPAGSIQSTKPKAGKDPAGASGPKAGWDPVGANRSKARWH